VWGGKSPPVQRETLLAPISEGGKKMLDLEARNEAIQLMRLKSYLNLDPETRAQWAYVADDQIKRYNVKSSNVDELSYANTYLQTWSPSLRKLPGQKHLPNALREMIRVANKYGVAFDTLNPSEELRKLLPMWHHFGEDTSKTQYNNKAQSKCLRSTHHVHTTGNGMEVISRLEDGGHRAEAGCTCIPCTEDRAINGCKDPHKCTLATRERLGLLLPKWDPRTDETEQIEIPDDGMTYFQAPKQIETLAEGFRVFTKHNDCDPLGEIPLDLIVPEDEPEQKICIHTQAGTTRNEGVLQAGDGIRWGENDPRNTSIRLATTQSQTLQCAEIVTALKRPPRPPHSKL
jgi:hypothetical protein